MRLVPLLWLVLSSFVGSCRTSRTDRDAAATMAAERASYDRLGALLETIRDDSPAAVFEGLPHPQAESDVYASESRRKDTFTNHGFKFYTPHYYWGGKGTGAITHIARSLETYNRWTGPKFCGGFHPDLLVRFGRGRETVDCHICLGCGEAIFFTATDMIHVNLEAAADKQLQIWQRFKMMYRPKSRLLIEETIGNPKPESCLGDTQSGCMQRLEEVPSILSAT
jgi:hypothetical protein